MTDQISETVNREVISNQEYIGASALQLRLDVTPIIRGLKDFLRGWRWIEEEDDKGSIELVKQKFGPQRMNEGGIISLLWMVEMAINNAVVQGAFYSDKKGFSQKYEQFIEELHLNFNDALCQNINNWEIKDSDYDLILDTIISLCIPFFSRLLDDGERKSYGASLRSNETNTIREAPKGIAKLFGG